MDDPKNIKDELKAFAPDLLNLEKKEGYQVPPRYFDRLGDEVIYRMKMEEQANQVENTSWVEVVKGVLQNLLQPRLAIGLTAIALLFIGIQQFMPGTESEVSTMSFAALTDAEFETYLSENIYDFEEELLNDLAGEIAYVPESIGDEELDNFFEDANEGLNLDELEELLL